MGDFVVPVPREVLAKAPNEKSLTLGIRPETFSLASDNQGIPVDVAVVEELGADGYVYGTLAGLPEDERLTAAQIVARVSTRVPPKRGETIRLAVSPENVHVFSNESQLRISGGTNTWRNA